MPLERDPQTGRLRVVPMQNIGAEGEDPYFDGLDLGAMEAGDAAPQSDDEFGARNYVALAIRGLSSLVPGGPWGAAAGGVGEGLAQLVEGDLNIPQIGAQAALGWVPFGRTAGLLRTGAKAAAHGALGGAGTELAEQIDQGDLDVGRLASGAKRGALIGGTAGTAGYGLLRRFLSEGGGAATSGGTRLRRSPGARGEFDIEGTPASVGTTPSEGIARTSRVPYRGPLEARDPGADTALGEIVESAQDTIARRSGQGRDPLAELLGVQPTSRVPYMSVSGPTKHKGGVRGDIDPDRASRLHAAPSPQVDSPAPANRLAATQVSSPAPVADPGSSPLARLAGLDETARRMAREAADEGDEIDLTDEINALVGGGADARAAAAAGSANPLARLLRVSAPEFRDIQDARVRLADKTAGLSLPPGMRDQIDRMGLEYRRTRDAFNALRQDPAADPRELQRLQQATRELGSRLSGMEREAVRAAQTQVPTIKGGAPEAEAPLPPDRAGHFKLPETRVPDEQYNAVRRMLGIEESPLAQAERRVSDVGSPTGVERRGLDPRVSGLMADESGAMTPEMAIALGSGGIGSLVGAWQADPEDRLRDSALGFLFGAGIPTLARRDPETLRKLEQWRAGAMLSGGAQVKNILGQTGAIGHEAARAALSGDTTLARNLLREFFSAEHVNRARNAFLDPTTDFERGTSPRGGPLAIFGKTMGATDAATRGSMEAAGMSPEAARRAVLVADPTTQEGRRFLSYHNSSPLARFFVPFARTNVNQLERFAETLRDIPEIAGGVGAGTPGRDALARLLLAGGAAYGGYELGQEFPNATPFLTAAAGPAGIPFLLGSTVGRLTDEGEENGDILRGVAREVGRNLPLATDYALDPARILASYIPNILRVLNLDTERRETRGSIFGPAIAKIPFLSETLPER